MIVTRMRNAPGGVFLALCCAATLSAQAPVPPPSAVESWLTEFDAAFEARDLERYAACFVPVHARRHAAHLARIERVFDTGAELQRDSDALRHWRLDEHRISLVRSTTRRADRQDGDGVVEHALVALRTVADAAVRAGLFVEVDADFLGAIPPSRDDAERPKCALRCHSCNYDIDAGREWLMVPNSKLRIGCLESLSFYALHADVVVDLTVHMGPGGGRLATPARQLRGLVVATGAAPQRGTTGQLDVTAWVPPAYAGGEAPARLRGATAAFPGPGPGHRTEAYLTCYGRVGYLFTVTGSRDALRRHRPAIDRLLASFRLLEPELDPTELTDRILEERLGGRVDGSSYHNVHYGVHLQGISGWPPELGAAGDAFDVIWRCPEESGVVRAHAFPPPGGMSHWSRSAATAMIRAGLRREATVVDEAGTWIADEAHSGFSWRREYTLRRPGDVWSALHVYLDDDLLLVIEGRAYAGRAQTDVRRALDGVTRDD